MTAIDNTQDIMDSRDIIDRIGELQDDEERASDDQKELDALLSFQSELSPYCADWEYGETVIRGSYFQEYAQELAEDIGAISASATWPNNCIDWESAANELKYDYTCAYFDGVEYWARSG